MITLHNVSKGFDAGGRRKTVLQGLTMRIPVGLRLGLLGRNGAGKSTLLNLISGALKPDDGFVERRCRVSWPLGFRGSFHKALTGRQNVRFVAQIYDVDPDRLIAFVAAFSELGADLDLPISAYSSGMNARLAFGVSMGVEFDMYLVDETIAVGDDAFRRRCRAMFDTRLARSGLIMVSHGLQTLRDYCDAGIVLEEGRLEYFEDIEHAILRHQDNMRRPRPTPVMEMM